MLQQFAVFVNTLFKKRIGGRNRARTYDPLLVRQVLSQLSYAPVIGSGDWT